MEKDLAPFSVPCIGMSYEIILSLSVSQVLGLYCIILGSLFPISHFPSLEFTHSGYIGI